MPLKKSKRTGTLSSRSSAESIFSEDELSTLARELAAHLLEEIRSDRSLPRILLAGAMGTGKSTFARALLEALLVDRAAQGSPTFAIAHEYTADNGIRILHADGYRLKSEGELEDAGLLEPLWDPRVLIIFEWMDLFPETKNALLASKLSVYEIHLHFMSGEKSASSRDPMTMRRVALSGNTNWSTRGS